MSYLILGKKERNGSVFYFVDLGYERHGRHSARVWVSKKLVKSKDDNPTNVVVGKNKIIVKTEKGNYVLKPKEGYSVLMVGWKCGFRGWSKYEILNKDVVVEEIPFEKWDSPRGNLGISKYALICVKGDRLIVRLTRGGRLYGKPSEMTVEYIAEENGQKEQEVPEACLEDPELAEILED